MKDNSDTLINSSGKTFHQDSITDQVFCLTPTQICSTIEKEGITK